MSTADPHTPPPESDPAVDLVGAPAEAEQLRPLDEIEAELSGLATRIAVSTCRFLVLLAEFDDRQGWNTGGLASCVNWLSWRCGMSVTTAREQLRVAHALAGLPRTREAFGAGHLSYSKVRALTRVATPDTEADLIAVATSATASQLERFVAGVRTATSLADVNTRHAARSLRFREEPDGSYTFSGRCSPEDAAVLIEEVNRVGDYLRRTDTGQSTDPEPPPWLRESIVHGHSLIDALILICEQSVIAHPGHDTTDGASGGGAGDHTARGSRRGETVLHVTLEDLATARSVEESMSTPPAATSADDAEAGDRELATVTSLTARTGDAGASAEAPASPETAAIPGTGDTAPEADDDRPDTAKLVGPHLELGPALHPETARRLTCDTGVVAHLHARHRTGYTVVPNARPGRTLEVGGRVRSPNAALLRALWDRDQGCRAPGCHRRAFLNAHHIRHWADGGPTTLNNLVLLCSTHHRLLHEGNFDIILRPDGTVCFTTPDGRILGPTPPTGPAPAAVTPAAAVSTDPAAALATVATNAATVAATAAAVDATAADGMSTDPADPDGHRDPVHPLTPIGGGPLHLHDAVAIITTNWDLRDQAAQAEAEAGEAA